MVGMTRNETRNPSSFGAKLKVLQTKRGLTNEEAATEIGVGLRLYQMWRSGKRPGLPNLIRLANFYGVSAGYLLDDTEEKAA